MASARVLALVAAVVVLFAMFELLRRRQLREKYAVLWLAVGLAVVVLALVPGLLDTAAAAVGVVTPVNLLFFVSTLFLLLVAVHLSWESSRLEEETRTLAEEVALLRLSLEELRDAGHGPPSSGDPTCDDG
jgi:hypothetical protein